MYYEYMHLFRGRTINRLPGMQDKIFMASHRHCTIFESHCRAVQQALTWPDPHAGGACWINQWTNL